MNAHLFQSAAAIIRGQMHVDGVAEDEVLAWLDSMAEHMKPGDLRHLIKHMESQDIKTSSYRIEPFIIMVSLIGFLRCDAHLRKVISEVAGLLGYPAQWLEENACVPSMSSLSRMIFVLDASFTKFVGNVFQQFLDSHTDFRVCMLADASNRAGREWLFSEVFWMLTQDIPEFARAMRQLIALRQDKTPEE